MRRTTFGCYLEGQGHSFTFQQNSFRPITLWFEVSLQLFYRNDHHIETTCRVTVLPWRPRSQHDLAAKSWLAQNFIIWSWISQLLLTNYFSVSNTYSESITRFWPGLVFLLTWLMYFTVHLYCPFNLVNYIPVLHVKFVENTTLSTLPF